MLETLLEAFSTWWIRRKGEKWGRVITRRDGTPYLVRHYLFGKGQGEGWSLFLHQFVSSDPADEGVHDHPWSWAVAFVLVGGYMEWRLDKDQQEVVREIKPFRLNFLRGTDFHRVQLYHGPGSLLEHGGPDEQVAWTLFLHGPRVKQWGFLNPITKAYRKFVYGRANLDQY